MPRMIQGRYTPEQRKRISDSLKEYFKINPHPRQGKKLTQEQRERLSQAHKGLQKL